MAPKGEAYDIDWICSNISNVHVANNKDWFINFADFKTTYKHVYFSMPGTEVLGVGDVELKLVKSASPSGKKTFNTIVLKDVLYAPANIVNIFAACTQGFAIDFTNRKIVDASSGVTVGLEDVVKLPKLWLKGQPRGKTILDPANMYSISAEWSLEEQARWEAHKQRTTSGFTSRYNDDEKQWLKKNFGNEFKFLLQYELSIYKEEDRDEGQQIVKAMMANELHEDEEGEGEEENSFLADLEADPASHVADYHFNEAELEWIEKHHRHSGNFMRAYGLKPWDVEDCKEGKAIVQGFLHS